MDGDGIRQTGERDEFIVSARSWVRTPLSASRFCAGPVILSHVSTRRKVAGSILYEVECSFSLILPASQWPWVPLFPNINSARNLPGLQRGRCGRLTSSVERMWGASTSHNLMGFHGLLQGQLYFGLKNAFFWDVTPCGSCKNRRFGGTCRPRHQGDSSLRSLLVTANVVPSSPILVNLMMDALSYSETSLLTRATRRNIPEDTILHSYRGEYLKSYIALIGWTL
jgi:hypothetical protein